MKQKMIYLLLATFFLFLCAGNTLALNITTFDTLIGGSSWHNTTAEDQETEPGTLTGQVWDLEKFELNGSTLRMVGGYNFASGYQGYDSGDIFIDINGDALWGATAPSPPLTSNSIYKFDYAIDLDFGASKYRVYSLNAGSTLDVTLAIDKSSPWQLNSGGINTTEGALSTGSFSDAQGVHYWVDVDLQWLFDLGKNDFLTHYTYECGNDLMIGQVPEPATIMLSGLGLLGIATFLRRKYFKKT